MKKSICLVLLFFVSITMSLTAGDGLLQGYVKGTIVDSKNSKPVPFANIMLKQSNDSTFVSGTVSGSNEEFILPNIKEGKYFLAVSFIRYEKKTVSETTLSATDKEKSSGSIKIEPQNVTMKETEVTGQNLWKNSSLIRK